MANKPIHEIRIGSVKAAIWANDTEKGVIYNVTVGRIFRSGKQWKTSDSFGRDDLLTLSKVVDLAHSWIFQQQHSTPSEKQDAVNTA